MELTLNVDVECPEGKLGHATSLIVDPISREVTHLVVKDSLLGGTERLLPISWISKSSHDKITARCSMVDWKKAEPFVKSEFVKREEPEYTTEGYGWPYVVTTRITEEYELIKQEQIPLHTRELRRGSSVYASDGYIGTVEELLVDAQHKQITHLVLSAGHLLGKRDIVVPVHAIKTIEDDRIQLTLDKEAIDELPIVPVHRQFTVQRSQS